MKTALSSLRCLLLTAALSAAAASGAAAGEVNLYTDRQAVFLKPALELFEKESGMQVNVLFAKKGLLERMQAEGENSPADVVIAADIGRLKEFADAGVITPYQDAAIADAVLPGYAAAEWVALTRRMRVLFVRKEDAVNISSYEDLALPAHRGKICTRSGLHSYNIALYAEMIVRLGEEGARQWLAGVKENLARKPQGKDRAQIEDVARGLCGIGIANSYYYFQMLKDPNKRDLAGKVRIIAPAPAHVNVTGAALAAHAPNRANALALMRFLVSRPAQELYAAANSEFPARDDVALPPLLAGYADGLADAAPIADIARHRAAASRLVEETGFNR